MGCEDALTAAYCTTRQHVLVGWAQQWQPNKVLALAHRPPVYYSAPRACDTSDSEAPCKLTYPGAEGERRSRPRKRVRPAQVCLAYGEYEIELDSLAIARRTWRESVDFAHPDIYLQLMLTSAGALAAHSLPSTPGILVGSVQRETLDPDSHSKSLLDQHDGPYLYVNQPFECWSLISPTRK